MGIFCVALIFWTNSFLIKRRKKELGLYCVLGMERGHIAAMLLWETLYTAVICLVLGLGAGMLLSKLLFLGLLYVMDISTPIAFGIEPAAMLITAVLFGVIFLCTLAYNLYHVRLAKPVELLRGGSMGEKEPRASWLLAVVGVLSLGWGYYTAVTVSQPLNALLLFFAAVLCVILGTFCLFTAGSIAFLKWLRRRKNFYYQPGHFISVSGMIYRMKQNAAGLAAICILFTMVLVTVIHDGMPLHRAKRYASHPVSHRYPRLGNAGGRPEPGGRLSGGGKRRAAKRFTCRTAVRMAHMQLRQRSIHGCGRRIPGGQRLA